MIRSASRWIMKYVFFPTLHDDSHSWYTRWYLRDGMGWTSLIYVRQLLSFLLLFCSY